MKIWLLITGLAFVGSGYPQACFDAYDKLFEAGNEKLQYSEFHKLENRFLDDLRGCKAIDFNVRDIDGNELVFEGLRGKVVVLNFWFTTCMPCLKEIPELNKLKAKYDADEVVFIGFARDDSVKLNAFFKSFGPFNYQIVPESYAVAGSYKVIGWPESMVIDKYGRVYKAWAGTHGGAKNLVKGIQNAIDVCVDN